MSASWRNSPDTFFRLYPSKAAYQVSTFPKTLIFSQAARSMVPQRRAYHWTSTAPTHIPNYKSLKHHTYIPPSRVLSWLPPRYAVQYRQFTTTPTSLTGSQPSKPPVTQPSPLTIEQFHRLSDSYIDTLVAHLEEKQEEREDVDVEYSAGVLTVLLPPAGTFVLNKQPPNKQIWLSSPISGPKRYDWVATAGEERGERGKWTYLRDGSTLDALLSEEFGVLMEDT